MTAGRSPVEARRRALVDALPDLLLRLRADGIYLEIGGDISRLPDSPEFAEQLMRCVATSLEHGSLATVEGEQRDFEARVARPRARGTCATDPAGSDPRGLDVRSPAGAGTTIAAELPHERP